jgi:hypothetical protein
MRFGLRALARQGRFMIGALTLVVAAGTAQPASAEILYGIGRENGFNVIKTINTETGFVSAGIEMVALYPTDDGQAFIPAPDNSLYYGLAPGPDGSILGVTPFTYFNGFVTSNALASISPAGVVTFINTEMGALYPTDDGQAFIPATDTLPYYGFAPKTGGGLYGIAPTRDGNVLNRISPFGVYEAPLLPLGVTIPLGPGNSIFVPDTTQYLGFISAAQLLPPGNGGGDNGGGNNGGGNNGGGTPVPEPASVLLLLAGLALLCLSRRALPARAAAAVR